MTEKRPQSEHNSNRSMPPGTIIPELAYEDVEQAAQWLCEAFGFRRRLQIGSHRFQLVFGIGSMVVIQAAQAPDQGDESHATMVRVEDVDEHHARVKALGARILSEPETFPYGERQYSVQDPGGHRWTFTQSVADVDPSDWGGRAFDLT